MDTRQEKDCRRNFLLVLTLLLGLAWTADGSQAGVQMSKGHRPPPGQWPSSVLVTSSAGRCSGTLVGPQVLLTAAHCVPAPTLPQEVSVDGFKFVCTTPPGARSCPQQGPDLALCRSGEALEHRKLFESLSHDPKWSIAKRPVTLVGFGEPKLGVLQIGTARPAPPTAGTGCITVHWGAAACDGDSGGGTFLGTGQGRALVGVISVKILEPARSSMVRPRLVANKNLAPGPGKGNNGAIASNACQANASGLIDITSGPAVAFIHQWKQNNLDVKVCGLDAGAPDCR